MCLTVFTVVNNTFLLVAAVFFFLVVAKEPLYWPALEPLRRTILRFTVGNFFLFLNYVVHHPEAVSKMLSYRFPL